MLPYRDSRLTTIVLVVFFVLLAAYAYYEARGILFGPTIDVTSAVTESTEQFVLIEGTAERIASLKMNGKEISVTETGAFSEPYLLAPGLNRLIFDATDKYGRSRQAIVEILYTPPVGSTTVPAMPDAAASSTDAGVEPQRGEPVPSTESASTSPLAPTE